MLKWSYALSVLDAALGFTDSTSNKNIWLQELFFLIVMSCFYLTKN